MTTDRGPSTVAAGGRRVPLPSGGGASRVAHTICTFNANNLYVRYRFGRTFPGDRSAASMIEDEEWGYLPMYDPDLMTLFNPEQRELAARAMTNDKTNYPDLICLQEVESLLALRRLNEDHLDGQYRYAFLIDSRDFRQIDVGILSKLEILDIRTNVDEIDPTPDDPADPWLFSRDCLEIEVALTGNRQLSLFVNHLKSKYAESPAERAKADSLRRRQSERLRELLRERFPGNRYQSAWFAVVGDLNDEPPSDPVKPLTGVADLANVLDRLPDDCDRWTHWYRSESDVSQLDYILLSPALDAETAGMLPRIERRGISFSRILTDGGIGPKETDLHRIDGDPNPSRISFRFPRFPEVTPKSYASDHCPLFLEVP
jgi:endonuclease/exonuclease/phosphatase family metal-dependent hydrolase